MDNGSGNINIKKKRGNHIRFVIVGPKRKRTEPKIKKKIENPEIEKTYNNVPNICIKTEIKTIIRPHHDISGLTLTSSSLFSQIKNPLINGIRNE